VDAFIKTVLIKSAKYDYAEVDVDKNNLFIGANGAGKTTLLRAILYFYTANAKGLGISSAKKISFLDYYFPYEDSYIVYVYKKEKKYVLVTLYKNTKIQFRFCLLDTQPDIKKLFIQGNHPKERHALWNGLREMGGSLSNAMSASEYRQALYVKQGKVRYYSLFEAKEYEGFTKTLANIFINNKVDSEAIKRVIVSSLNAAKEIDIERIQKQLATFNQTYEDIIAYEKNIPLIEELIKNVKGFEKVRYQLEENLGTLAFSKIKTLQELETLQKTNKTLSNKKSVTEDEIQELTRLYNKRLARVNEAIGEYKGLLKRTKEKLAYYQEEKIEEKIAAYDTLAVLDNELQEIISQEEFITKIASELKVGHENRLKSLENSYSMQVNTIERKETDLLTKKNQKETDLRNEENDTLLMLEKDFLQKSSETKEHIQKLELDIQGLQNKLENEKKHHFIFSKEKDIHTLEKEIETTQSKLRESKHNLEILDAKLEKEESLAGYNETRILEKKHQQKELFNEKIERIKQLLAPQKSSLLYALQEKNLDLDKYLYCVNEDFLQSEMDADFIQNESMQFFELNLENFTIPANSLNVQLTELQKEKKKSEKFFDLEIEKLQQDFKKIQKQIYRDKRSSVEDIKTLDKSLLILTTQQSRLLEEKEHAYDVFEKEKKQNITQLQEALLQKKSEKKEHQTLLQQFELEKKKQYAVTKSFYTKKYNNIQRDFDSEQQKLQEQLRQLEQQKQQQIIEQEELYKKRLQEKNIDVTALEKLKKQKNALEEKLRKVHSYAEIIARYKGDKEEYIDKQKSNEKKLKSLQEEQKKLQVQYTIDKNLKTEELDKYKREIDANAEKIKAYETSLARVAEFEASSAMQECKNIGLSYEPNNHYEILDTLLDAIYNLLANYREIEKGIAKLLNKLQDLFGTSLQIKRYEDALQSAYALEEYHTKEKIKSVKEWQTRELGLIVKSVVDEYNTLMNNSQKIESLVKKISKLFGEIQIGVVDELSLRYLQSNNRVIEKLKQIKAVNDDNPHGYGVSLFNDTDNSKEMLRLLKNLRDTIEYENIQTLTLEDSFVLEFRVIENGNDSKFQTSLDNIGSNGTDVLVKTMIYIAMLYIFKTKTTKKELAIHVILDEIGILSQRYLKELIEFANRYNIYFINGAPDEKLIGTYKRVFLISNKNAKAVVREIISK